MLGVADARMIWVKYYDGKDGKEKVELCAVTHKGEVSVLNTNNVVRGTAQNWLAEGVCKRLNIKRLPPGAALPKDDYQGS